MMEEQPGGQPPTTNIVIRLPKIKWRKVWRLVGIVAALAIVATVGVVGTKYYRSHYAHGAAPLPSSIRQQIKDFTPYNVRPGTDGFTASADSMQYEQGVLIFQLKSGSGKTVAVSEQAIPSGFDRTSLKTSDSIKDVTTGLGSGYLNDSPEQTTAALFTKDGTWLMLSAPDPIGAPTMTDILNKLAADR
jgi:hypothetical protein